MNDKKENINILICGDICPTKDTSQYFDKGNYENIFNDVLPLMASSDILIGNLEFPLINNGKGISKTGPILKGDNHYINVFKKSKFTALSLANNHIKDCGEEGVLNTIKVCQKAGIKTFGAGNTLKEAKQPLIINKKGWKIGFISFAEYEFNAANENSPGSNLLDPYEDFDTIRELRKKVDYLIVLYHGGIEYYPFASPLLQKKCRKLIASGADFVTCQHSHVVGTEEQYMHGKILYGQGNTIFGYRSKSTTWNEGLLVSINLTEDHNLVEHIPIKFKNGGAHLMNNVEQKNLFRTMKKRQKLSQSNEFLERSWDLFCESQKALYLPLLLGEGRVLNKLNRMCNNKIINYKYSKKNLMTTHNIIRCESHNEVVMTIFDNSRE